MDKLKIISFLLIIWPIFLFGQKLTYPNDTIYVLYQQEKDKEWNAKFERKYNQKLGIYFNIESRKGNMTLFYSYSEKADTLCIRYLEEHHFSDLEEIREKERNWVNKNYKNHKYKPYTGSKNPVFQTYVIEVISDKKIVKYPVIWRNERI